MNFCIGRNNLAATIFVPYDCKNNCPFCTSKEAYKCTDGFSGQAIINSIEKINKLPFIPDVVFTGGEPFANINGLKQLVSAVDDSKNVFINTTLPIDTASEAIEFINNNKKIKGVNISRHTKKYVQECEDRIIGLINKPVNINCVISTGIDPKVIEMVIKRWSTMPYLTIKLRADYRNITMANLKTIDDVVLKLEELGLKYLNSGGCLVCNDDVFSYNGQKISYHRGIECSSVKIGNTTVINDIIIDQRGKISYDWNGDCTDIDKIL